MLTFIYITNNLELARIAVNAGVGRIFVDLEIHGKHERQGHLDTVISGHTLDDVYQIRESVPEAELLVRLNPIHSDTRQEVEEVLEAGADLIMLPMFHTLNEVRILSHFVQGRAGIVPLIETVASLNIAREISEVEGIIELYVGLNDLHMDLKNHFIFQPLAEGLLDPVALIAKRSKIRFGFGGVARIGEGAIPGELILGEHLRLGSDSVILSRTFYRHDDPDRLNDNSDQVFSDEVKKLRATEKLLSKRSLSSVKDDHKKFVNQVNKIVTTKQQGVL